MSQAPPLPAPTDSAAPLWARILGTLGGLTLGAVLVFALYAKVLDPLGFVELIEHEGLDFLLPASWVAALGLGLEAVLGFALLFNLRRRWVLIPSAGLVAFFVFLTARTYYRHVSGDHDDTGSCGCFGNLVQRSPAEAFWQDLLLLVPPLLLAFLGLPPRPMAFERLRWGLTWGLSALVLGFAWFAPGLPLDDFATRLYPGVTASALCAGEDDGRICMDDVIPEIGEEGHVVILARLDDPAFLERLEAFNDYALEMRGPPLWIVSPASEEDVDLFSMTHQPAFPVLPCPPGVVRPLYRTLPRSFLARDGVVTSTWQGWPPLADLAAAAPDDDSMDDEETDDGSDGDDDGEQDAPGGVDPEDDGSADDGSDGEAGEDDPDEADDGK